MKYEIKNAENTALKTFVVMVFYIFSLFISMFIFSNIQQEDVVKFNKILSYLCYPIFKEYLFNENLLYIFNNIFFALYFAIFYIYEYINIHNNIATRYNTKKWIIHKYLIGIAVIIIISLIQYGCIFYIFKDSMPSSLKYYIYPIVYKTLIMTYVYTLYNIFKTNKMVFVIMFLLSFISLVYCNIILYIILIIFTFIFNYLFFDLKLFKYVFKRKII